MSNRTLDLRQSRALAAGRSLGQIGLQPGSLSLKFVSIRGQSFECLLISDAARMQPNVQCPRPQVVGAIKVGGAILEGSVWT